MADTPIYQLVKDALRAKIESGTLLAGDMVPGEEQLAADFNCSRLTAHRALRELADEGLVVRRRRAGTQVAPRDSGGVLIRIPSIREEIEGRGFAYRYELLSRRHAAPDGEIARALGAGKGERHLNVVGRHWAGGRVFQHDTRWINLEQVPAALEVDFSTVSANHWLLENVPYTGVDHEISALAADGTSAEALEVAEGTALLRIERVSRLGDRPITHASMLHPGALFSLKSERR
ncbi:GntR family transcriptional regulator [Thalassobaculum sp.]|uniref:GntR family transcriptional regulator n=1 Tax=Thalassobaculum sp. TaxID=2022740 RepID=UPI003B5966CA